MSEIRVILSEMPPLLRDIMHDVLHGDATIRIVGEVERNAEAAAAAERAGAHVVVTGEPGEDDRVTCRLLVVARRDEHGSAAGPVELHEKPLGDVSPGELVEAIRHAVSERTEENPWRHS